MKKEEEKVDLLFKSVGLSVSQLENKFVLIIPVDGCSGCVTAVIEFVRHNTDKELLYSIISSPTRKDVTIKAGEVPDNGRVFLDIGSKARLWGIISYYPVIIYMKDEGHFLAFELNSINVEGELLHLSSKLQAHGESSGNDR